MTDSTWRLLGITKGAGDCEHCGRRLSRLFRVAGPDGAEMVVGRRCAAGLTGYDWTTAAALRAQAIADADRAAEARYGEMYRELRRRATREAAAHGVTGAAGEGVCALRDRRPWQSEEDAVAFAREMLAASAAFAREVR
jgi:ribosome-binding protein aMBF1 (putative translation factor)